MRLITYKKEGSAQIGIRQDGWVIPVNNLDGDFPSSISQLLAEDKLPLLAKKLENYPMQRMQQKVVQQYHLIQKYFIGEVLP